MRQIDQHAESIHLPHYILAILTHPVPERGIGRKSAVRVLVIAVVVQRDVANTELMVEPQRGSRIADHVQALNAHHRRDLLPSVGSPCRTRCECNLEIIGVGVCQTADEVNLLQCVVDVFGVDAVGEVVGGAGTAGEDAPEGAPDAALVQAWDVHVATEGRGECEVGAVDVVVVD